MISKMILKKLTILESKNQEVKEYMLKLAESMAELSKEQKIIRRKQNDAYKAFIDLLARLQQHK